MHNLLAIAWNSIVSVAKKIEDNMLHIMTVQVIALQPTVPQNPVANPLYALFKVPNALVIKWVHMPMGNLKAAKPWPKLAKA